MNSLFSEREFSAELRRLPSGVLHLGSKSKFLRKAGYTTVGELVDAWPTINGSMPGLGKASIDKIGERLSAVADSRSATGLFDWDRYSMLSNIPLVPSKTRPRNGEEFLRTLPAALEEIASGLSDQVYSRILKDRLAKPPAEQMTLDAIAQSGGYSISRERVRQKQRKLLNELAGALIWENFDGLGALFRPSFTIWWKLAARHFRHHEDIDFDALVTGLCEVWDVTAELLMEQIPFVVAVITGDNKMPMGFKSSIKLRPNLYDRLIPETRDVELSRLRLGKYAFELQRKGVTTIGDLIEVCRIGRSSVITSKAGCAGIGELDLVAQSLNENGEIEWADYRLNADLKVLPSSSPRSSDAFVDNLVSTISSLLEIAKVTGRAKMIYDLRTGRIREERLTLAQVAKRLETHGPSVKREESVFLQYLNDVLLQQEYCKSPVWIDESWIKYWRDAAEEYESSEDDFYVFRRRLSKRWSISINRLIPVSPTLWAVIGGYPNGRPIRNTAPSLENEAEESRAVSIIRLRGFRRVH